MLSVENYKYIPWNIKFQNEVSLEKISIYDKHWHDYFGRLFEKNLFGKLENKLQEEIKSGYEIYPYPNLVFNAFNQCNFDDIKVVILGQDPYPKSQTFENMKIPQAMGLSFSVPIGMKIPSSLQNIYKNQLKYLDIEIPKHGNLQFWASQGCLLLNSSLTVREEKPNSHATYWKMITDKIIKHISTKHDDVVFVLWGNNAYDKMDMIDTNKHECVISSHPSGLSCDKPMKIYSAFREVNHFGKINDLLSKHGKRGIMWMNPFRL